MTLDHSQTDVVDEEMGITPQDIVVRQQFLVVEDEPLLSMLMEDMLLDLGYRVLGPVACVSEALILLEQAEDVGAALLDFSLRGEQSLEVADALLARGVPFAFISGHGPSVLDGCRHAGSPVLGKPFSVKQFEGLLREVAPLVVSGGSTH